MSSLRTRAAEIFGGFWSQTPPLSLTQNLTAYQFLGPYKIILPRHESFKIGNFQANIEIKWPALKLLCCGITMLWDPKIGMESCFGSNSMVEFDSKIPQNLGCPIVHSGKQIARFSAEPNVYYP